MFDVVTANSILITVIYTIILQCDFCLIKIIINISDIFYKMPTSFKTKQCLYLKAKLIE